MKVGIIGFARSGKTTVFNVLTGAHAAVGAFGSRDANVAVVKVYDGRVDRLAELCESRKRVYAEFEFLDVAPNEAGGEQKALDPAALNLLKNADALAHVVRAFGREDVAHPAGSVDPVRDAAALEEELRLTDLILIENRLQRLEKEHRKDLEFDLLTRCREHIESGAPLRTLELTDQEEHELAGFTFLSQKRMMLVGNYGEEEIGASNPAGLEAYAAERNQTLIALCGELELEVAQLPEDDRQAFRDDLGLGEGSCERFIQAAFEMLGLITFLTVGNKEARAWTIPEGTRTLDAAGAVHTDMQRGFIRAEVVHYDDLIAAGSMQKAKEQGHVRLEGKSYVVRDGDVILFRFNV